MNIFKPLCQPNNASIPGAIEKVYDALAELSDAMSQVSDSMAKVLSAVLSLPMAFVPSSNADIIDTSIAKDVKESYKNFKYCPPGKTNAAQKDQIVEATQKMKVV